MQKNIFCVSVFFLVSFLLFSQTVPEKKPETEKSTLPRGYEGVELGMNIDSVKDVLKNNAAFGFRGERDVSILPMQNRVLIETAGYSYIGRSWFQFYEESLYIIIINFNESKMDYYSIFTTLNTKYGEPFLVTPAKILWKDENVMVSLERPLTLKYIDVPTFESLQENSQVQKSQTEILRQGFLDSL